MNTMLDGFSKIIFNIYEAFTVALFSKEDSSLRCLSSETLSRSFDKKKDILIEGTLPGWVIKHNEPLIIPNFDKDEATLGYYNKTEDIKSFMGYPIENKGVIIIDSKKKWAFTDKEKKILGAFASMLNKEIEREKRTLDMEESIEELYSERRIVHLFNELNLSRTSLNELFIECLSLSGADLCFICVEKGGKMFVHDFFGIDSDGYVKKECSLGASITSMIMEGGRELLLPYNSRLLREKPMFFSGETLKAKQFFGFPLITDDIIIGVAGYVSVSDKQLIERSIGILRNVSTLLSLYCSSLWMKDNLERLRDFEPVTDSIQFPVFLEILENMTKKGDKYSLLSLKLKNIRLFNKHMGLSYTNNLLKKIFKIIRYCVGGQAFITRKGGGHFYVLSRSDERVDFKNIMRILDYTINKSIAEENITYISSGIETGVARFPEDGTVNIWELLNIAEGRKDF
ncbi:MAG: GAF domain-containing protein [Proteobacteria bacterium]|nr:GAF domain-containing protein [Pseudomonadota bacterium]